LFDTLDLNLTGPCYDVAFYQDGIIFLKPGEETTYLALLDRPDPEKSRPLFLNRQFSCSPAGFSFSGDHSRGYYTRKVKRDGKRNVEKIFEMFIENDTVSDLRQVPFTSDPSRYLHPAVSSDGSLMVFSSDCLPTSGGLDLFVTRKTSAGWSKPINIGASINSSGHEWFPFLDNLNNLWFSSTGHSGYGGYDIYISPYNGREWGLPQNLGKSINGPQNELGMSVHPLKQMALFSSVLPSESGGIAIRVTLNEDAIEGPSARNISLAMQRMADPAVQPVPRHQTEPEIEPGAAHDEEEDLEPLAKPDPNRVVFRVQIISSLNADSFPTVLVAGESYTTYEYFYKGSYRITVGQFDSTEEANAFRLQCKSSGFKQAFVAAFRGDKRETDPSVFKQ
ncbi:MAG: hypothetical protein K8R52_01630, partial [Bacteroidales bacterium]|nr:hypothetical protein [Bacteroidales bacterium]